MEIGRKLKSLRIEKGFEPIDMALKLNISETTWRRYESNKATPDVNMLEKIAKTLDKNFLDLLPAECLVQNNTDQKGGVVVNLGTINNLSEKLIEQYEIRLKNTEEKNKDQEMEIAEKDNIINEQNEKIEELEARLKILMTKSK